MQEVVCAHERVVGMLLESITPLQQAVQQETADVAQEASPEASGVLKRGVRSLGGAVAALQLKVAVATLAGSLMSSEFQEAACVRHVPACFGCAHRTPSPCPLGV